MIEKIKSDLGINYKNEPLDKVLFDIIEDITSIACNISHRPKYDEKLYPYIKRAVKAEYLKRGNEGMLSRSEGSVSSTYEDTIEKLRNDIIKNGLRRLI